jgi:hypothetical protein
MLLNPKGIDAIAKLHIEAIKKIDELYGLK